MLVQRRRRWTGIKEAFVERLVFDGKQSVSVSSEMMSPVSVTLTSSLPGCSLGRLSVCPVSGSDNRS